MISVFRVVSQSGETIAPCMRLAYPPAVGEFLRVPGRGDVQIRTVVHVPVSEEEPGVELWCWVSGERQSAKQKTPPPDRPRRRSRPR